MKAFSIHQSIVNDYQRYLRSFTHIKDQRIRKAYIYLCHNRKTADMAAQPNDKALTDRMIQVGNIVGITFFDHIIINAKTEDFLSFQDVGLMEELKKSTAWIPKFEQIKKIRSMAKEEERKKMQISIAKTLKKKKVEPAIISTAAGLTIEEIQKLK